MTTLDPQDAYMTLINIFTVDPDHSAELIEVLSRVTEEAFVPQPGFVSANLHTSLDGTHVANYVQWRSTQDLEAASAQPEVQAAMKEAAGVAEAFQPILYRLRSAHHPAG